MSEVSQGDFSQGSSRSGGGPNNKKRPTRWPSVIRKILDQQKREQEERLNDEPADIWGEELANALNNHPAFQPPARPPSEQNDLDKQGDDDEEDENAEFHPLLSSANLSKLKSPRRTARNVSRQVGQQWSYLTCGVGSIRQLLRVLCMFLLAIGIILGYASQVVLVSSTRVLLVAFFYVLSFIVDMDEIKAACPKPVLQLLHVPIKIGQWLDSYVFRRAKIAGREWNKEGEYCFQHDEYKVADSCQEASLWYLPPPLSQDEWAADMPPSQWSEPTRKHAKAIGFCYKMLQDEAKRKAASKARRASKRAVVERRGQFAQQQSMETSNITVIAEETSFDLDSKLLEEHDKLLVATGTAVDKSVQMARLRTQSMSPLQDSSCVELIRRPTLSPQTTEDSKIMRSYSDSDLLSPSTTFDNGDDTSLSTLEDDSGLYSRRLQRILSADDTDNDDDFSNTSDAASDMNWIDVGAQIGMRLLSSEHVQRAVASQDTADRIKIISQQVENKFGTPKATGDGASSRTPPASFVDDGMRSPLHVGMPDISDTGSAVSTPGRTSTIPIQKPVHSMWTSASAAGSSVYDQANDDDDEDSLHMVSTPRRRGRDFLSPTRSLSSPPLDDRTKLSSTLKGNLCRENGTSTVGASSHKNVSSRAFSTLSDSCARKNATSIISDLSQEGEETVEVCTSRDSESPVVDTGVEYRDEPDSASVHLSLTGKPGAGSEMSWQGLSSSPARVSKTRIRRAALPPGAKLVVPMFPIQPGMKRRGQMAPSFYQMATVLSSKRIYVQPSSFHAMDDSYTNCLSIRVSLDGSFLRGGGFAEMTVRVMDDWPDQYMPRHSKFSIGACIATSYGVGVLVGWRVENDCHVVRSLWQRRGPGSAHAYLNRNALHKVVEAAVGFMVETNLGQGVVVAYRDGDRHIPARYFVQIKEQGSHFGKVLEFNHFDVTDCQGPAFVPVIELIREAAHYQIQVDSYKAALRKQEVQDEALIDEKGWQNFSAGFETIWASFLKAMEDKEIDEGVNKFFLSVIAFLERLDHPEEDTTDDSNEEPLVLSEDSEDDKDSAPGSSKPGFWFAEDLFGGLFKDNSFHTSTDIISPTNSGVEAVLGPRPENSEIYNVCFAVIRALMKTVSIARAASVDQPNLRLGLSICYEFLLFARAVVKVQQRNVSATSLEVWKRAITEIKDTFGPVKERLQKVGQGIAARLERHGNRAKVRTLRFVDIILLDEMLLLSLERADWQTVITRVEHALVQAKIIDEKSRPQYRNTVKIIVDHFSPTSSNTKAASRNSEKMLKLAKAIKLFAHPRRSTLKLIRSDAVMDLLERIFIRVFRNDASASQMIRIHAFNFHSLRQLRMLKDLTISAMLWMPILDAADEEFTWTVKKMPETTKDIMVPLSKLFSLCVAQFHDIADGDLTADWLDFMMEEDAVELIHEIDVQLILSVEAFSKDVKEVMTVLPYYPSIHDDILDLMDEVDVDELLREASAALADADKLADFLRDKATLAIEKFLDFLPKMSIPVERRDLGDGWGLTCLGEDGGDLTLSDVNVKRENLTCQLLGGEAIFIPIVLGEQDPDDEVESAAGSPERSRQQKVCSPPPPEIELSVLDEVRELLLNAQEHGCWQPGSGGVGHQSPSDPHVAKALGGLPVSAVLNSGIDLWTNLEIDDDELMEIAIRDVSYQIQLQKEREESLTSSQLERSFVNGSPNGTTSHSGFGTSQGRFNPRVDPTVVFLDIQKLTLNLDKFHFRIEPLERKLFDPSFEGFGSLCIRNMSMKLRVECKKERDTKIGQEVPVLQLRQLEVSLEKVKVKVKDTGADWLLNSAVKQFSGNITKVVETNLKEQVQLQIQNALEHLNAYFVVNPDLFLGLLGITLDDLEENVVWV